MHLFRRSAWKKAFLGIDLRSTHSRRIWCIVVFAAVKCWGNFFLTERGVTTSSMKLSPLTMRFTTSQTSSSEFTGNIPIVFPGQYSIFSFYEKKTSVFFMDFVNSHSFFKLDYLPVFEVLARKHLLCHRHHRHLPVACLLLFSLKNNRFKRMVDYYWFEHADYNVALRWLNHRHGQFR